METHCKRHRQRRHHKTLRLHHGGWEAASRFEEMHTALLGCRSATGAENVFSSMSLSLAMVRVMIQNGEQDVPWKFERAPSPADGWEELEDPVHPCVSLMRKEMEQAANLLLKHPGLHSQWHWFQRAMVIYK